MDGISVDTDMSAPCENGYINIRVGAIIIKDNKYLMVGNEASDYLYSVGGRIKFGETAEEAVIREVYEETGVKMEINRLGFVHENYFYGDFSDKAGKLIYEISFFFYMNAPNDFLPVNSTFAENGSKEYLTWISTEDKNRNIYPNFFTTELKHPSVDVKHFVTDDRI